MYFNWYHDNVHGNDNNSDNDGDDKGDDFNNGDKGARSLDEVDFFHIVS